MTAAARRFRLRRVRAPHRPRPVRDLLLGVALPLFCLAADPIVLAWIRYRASARTGDRLDGLYRTLTGRPIEDRVRRLWD